MHMMASDERKGMNGSFGGGHRDTLEEKMDKTTGLKISTSLLSPSSLRAAIPHTSNLSNNPILPVISYCGSSILMTCTNKFVLSTLNFNLNFLLLVVQASVCVTAIQICKRAGLITFRDFNIDEARKWFPVSLLLIGMLHTSTKALQYLSIPVYTIFKNLTIILIAYGEVLWFGGTVTSMALFSFGLMVLSSVIAAWADIQHALETYNSEANALRLSDYGSLSPEASAELATLNSGYVWMLINCLCSAAYLLAMRKRIKLTNFKDFDTMYYNNLLSIPVLLVCSLFVENWSSVNLNLNFPYGARTGIFSAMVVSGLSSLFISYTSAWCVRVTSSTTYSMVGALNKLPIALSGLIFFDAPITLPSVSAILVGFISGIIYAVAKVRQTADNMKRTPGSNANGSVPLLPFSERKVVSASSQSARDSFKE